MSSKKAAHCRSLTLNIYRKLWRSPKIWGTTLDARASATRRMTPSRPSPSVPTFLPLSAPRRRSLLPTPQPRGLSSPKRPSQQPVNAEAPSPPKRLRLPGAPQWDPKSKGLFYLKDLTDVHPFSLDVNACSGFTCHGQEMPQPQGKM